MKGKVSDAALLDIQFSAFSPEECISRIALLLTKLVLLFDWVRMALNPKMSSLIVVEVESVPFYISLGPASTILPWIRNMVRMYPSVVVT